MSPIREPAPVMPLEAERPEPATLADQAYARLKHPTGKSLSAELLRPGLLDEDDLALIDRPADNDAHRDVVL